MGKRKEKNEKKTENEEIWRLFHRLKDFCQVREIHDWIWKQEKTETI
jgi:hypothetical protein